MGLDRLRVRNFRSLREVDLRPGNGVNAIFGRNGAGKTSLLEAIHCLGRARSFRSGKIGYLIARGESSFVVQGEGTGGDGRRMSVGVQRARGGTRVRVNGQEVRSLSGLARSFPVQVFNRDSVRMLSDGPRVRRALLNWTVFHVERNYGAAWIRFEKLLRQRNAALKAGDERVTSAWTSEFVSAAESVHEIREKYMRELAVGLVSRVAGWLGGVAVEVRYRRGWPQDAELADVLVGCRARELEAGFSLYGPHRADLLFRCEGEEAQEVLSGGQKKLLVIALVLAQIDLWRVSGNQEPILLVDDLRAELDEENACRVVNAIEMSGVQSFVTSIERSRLVAQSNPIKWFHVEHGRCSEVV